MRIPQVFTLIPHNFTVYTAVYTTITICYALGHISVNYIKTKSINNRLIINAYNQSG